MDDIASTYGHRGYAHAPASGERQIGRDQAAYARPGRGHDHRAAFPPQYSQRVDYGYDQLYSNRRLSTGAFMKEGALTFGAVSALSSGAMGALLGMVTGGPVAALAFGSAMAIAGGISGAVSGAITGAAVAATNPGSHQDIARRAALVAGAVGVVSALVFTRGNLANKAINAVTGGAMDYLIGSWMGKRLARKAAGY